LKPAVLPEPDLSSPRVHALTLGASAIATQYAKLAPIVLPDGTRIDLLDALCSNGGTFWAIDGKTWPRAGHQDAPPPFAKFNRGETVVIEFLNTTKQPHPMHLHGHSFKVLSASRLQRPVHWADTVLVMPDERVRIAFVADNPGNWMMHCHVIEHQDTGMMAWFEIA
jgi:FtsP/CotA-like multicopper oxidase with cupredoxin domain